MLRYQGKEAPSFSEEKEAKRLLFSCCASLCGQPADSALMQDENKSLFGSFSSEKEHPS
jgi:hypothetical protein